MFSDVEKSKHGTFRPNLLKLATSNAADEIITCSRMAFRECSQIVDLNAPVPPDLSKPIATLTKLRGIGPATASLVLSCYDPDMIPFFSDELFRYVHWTESAGGKGDKNGGGKGGGGWSRKIKYTVAEYKSLVVKVWLWRRKMKEESGEWIRTIDLEKVAYTLGKGSEEDLDVDADDGNDEEAEEKEGDSNIEQNIPTGTDKSPANKNARKRELQISATESKQSHRARRKLR